jgi:hypothetical protein
LVFSSGYRGSNDRDWNFDHRVVDPSSGLTFHLLQAGGTDASSLGRSMQMERIPAWLQAIKSNRHGDQFCLSTSLRFPRFGFSISLAC